jgi:hypothetical protein
MPTGLDVGSGMMRRPSAFLGVDPPARMERCGSSISEGAEVKGYNLQAQHPADSTAVIDDAQWSVYENVMDGLARAGIPFALGGAFGLAIYTGCHRNTKDLDLCILPADRAGAIDVATRVGLTDYFDQAPYERHWIYRATTRGVIVDIIWEMANRRAVIDSWWMSGPSVQLRGRSVKVVPPETMLWDKLYILQRDRCDWPDVLNLLYYQGEKLAWREVLDRLEDDIPLLTGALAVFRWLSPGVSSRFPEWLWSAVNMSACEASIEQEILPEHAARLDKRPWYGNEPATRARG